jgi:hypothetical protein
MSVEHGYGSLIEAPVNIFSKGAPAGVGTDVHKLAQGIRDAISPLLRGRYHTVQVIDVYGQAQAIYIRFANIAPELSGHNVAYHNDPFSSHFSIHGFNPDGSAQSRIKLEVLRQHFTLKRMRGKTVKPGKTHVMDKHIKKYVAGVAKNMPAPRTESVSADAPLSEADTYDLAFAGAMLEDRSTTDAVLAEATRYMHHKGGYLGKKHISFLKKAAKLASPSGALSWQSLAARPKDPLTVHLINAADAGKKPQEALDSYEAKMESLDEVSPPGFSGTVKAMKKRHPEIDNPWALAWSMYKKGAKPHKKPEKGKPRYKSPEKHEAEKEAKKAEEDMQEFEEATFYDVARLVYEYVAAHDGEFNVTQLAENAALAAIEEGLADDHYPEPFRQVIERMLEDGLLSFADVLDELEYASFYKPPAPLKKAKKKAKKAPKRRKMVVVPFGDDPFPEFGDPVGKDPVLDKRIVRNAKRMLKGLGATDKTRLKKLFPAYLAFLVATSKGMKSYKAFQKKKLKPKEQTQARLAWEDAGWGGTKATGQIRGTILHYGMPKAKPEDTKLRSTPQPKAKPANIPVNPDFDAELGKLKSKHLQALISKLVTVGVPSSKKGRWKLSHKDVAAELGAYLQQDAPQPGQKGGQVTVSMSGQSLIIDTPLGSIGVKGKSKVSFVPEKALLESVEETETMEESTMSGGVGSFMQLGSAFLRRPNNFTGAWNTWEEDDEEDEEPAHDKRTGIGFNEKWTQTSSELLDEGDYNGKKTRKQRSKENKARFAKLSPKEKAKTKGDKPFHPDVKESLGGAIDAFRSMDEAKTRKQRSKENKARFAKLSPKEKAKTKGDEPFHPDVKESIGDAVAAFRSL